MATKQRDYQYDFVDPLPEECPCPVCLEVQVDPHQVTCCGKIFCKSCLDQLIERKQNCPNCRNNLKGKYFPDLNTERRIKQLRVRCDNRLKGCQWVGYMKDLKDVHIPECPKHLVPCTNLCEKSDLSFLMSQAKCGVLVQRNILRRHMTQSCKWRRVKCSCCRLKGAHHFITGEHLQECPDVLVLCSNEGCEIKVKRRILPEHKTACPKQIVSCRYSSVGCKARITRENIVSHNQQCVEQHLDSAVDTVEKALKRIEILEAKAMKHSEVQNKVPIDVFEPNWDDSDIDDYDNDRCDYCGDYHPDTYRCPRDDSLDDEDDD